MPRLPMSNTRKISHMPGRACKNAAVELPWIREGLLMTSKCPVGDTTDVVLITDHLLQARQHTIYLHLSAVRVCCTVHVLHRCMWPSGCSWADGHQPHGVAQPWDIPMLSRAQLRSCQHADASHHHPPLHLHASLAVAALL